MACKCATLLQPRGSQAEAEGGEAGSQAGEGEGWVAAWQQEEEEAAAAKQQK